jgi:DME family drug/metabolite transporter
VSELDPAILAVAAAITFGAAMVATKVGLRHMPAAAGAAISIPTATVFFWCVAPFVLDTGNWDNRAAIIFAAVGLFFPALVTLFVFESNRRMGPTVASTVSSTAPLFAVTGAILFLHEKLSWPVAIGITGVVGGVMMLSWSGGDRLRDWPVWALLIPLGAALFRGLGQAVVKAGLNVWANPFAACLIGYTVSSLLLLCAAFLLGRKMPLNYRAGGMPWFALAGLFNGLGVFVMYTALGRGAVAIVSPIVASYPVFTFVLSAVFLRDEILSARVVAGVTLTVASVILMTMK